MLANEGATPPAASTRCNRSKGPFHSSRVAALANAYANELLKLNQRVAGLDNFATGYQRNLDEVRALVDSAQWASFRFIQGNIIFKLH